jgi:hypothetical protein
VDFELAIARVVVRGTSTRSCSSAVTWKVASVVATVTVSPACTIPT